jgi:lipid II:glycine glycyltransferase (peptidoglycan interpeptide bridge formation enzyme)
MSPGAQGWIQLAVLLIGLGATLLAAISHQTHYIDKRIDDLKSDLVARIEAMKIDFIARFEALDKRLNLMDKRMDEMRADLVARNESLEKRLIERIEHLEHPVTRA